MKRFTTAVAAAALIAFGGSAAAGELKLFGASLNSVSEDQMMSLAKQSGASLSSRANGIDVFDATGMQLPGIKSLTLAFHEGRFALARYSSKPAAQSSFGMDNEIDISEDEKLRKMLQDRYGRPVPQHGFPEPGPFGAQFVQGRYDWSFDAGLKLSYNKPFMGETTLTYFNPVVVAQLKRDANAANDSAIKADAAKLQNRF